MLTLNLNLLYTVVNILVLFLLLRKFLYKPVMNIIAQRQKQVDDALNAAETSKQEATAALNDAQAKLRNVDTEAAARRTAYEQQAEKDKQQLLADAQQQADAIRDQADQYERDTRYNAEEYADTVLAHLEENLKSLTNTVTRVRQTLDENSGPRNTTNNVPW